MLGNYCVLGGAPRDFSPEEVAELKRMADDVVAEIETRRPSAPSGSGAPAFPT